MYIYAYMYIYTHIDSNLEKKKLIYVSMVRNQALGRVELEICNLYKVHYLETVISYLFAPPLITLQINRTVITSTSAKTLKKNKIKQKKKLLKPSLKNIDSLHKCLTLPTKTGEEGVCVFRAEGGDGGRRRTHSSQSGQGGAANI